MGDFPTSHRELASLYKNGTLHDGNRWLRRFIRNNLDHSLIDWIDFSREDIARVFDGNQQVSSILNNKLEKWGNILDEARGCRNDSNYEGLIIAHEHAHQLVTDDFNNLAQILGNASRKILPEVISLFKQFIDKQSRKDSCYSYLNWIGLCYLEQSLRFRMLGESNMQQINNHNQLFNPGSDIQNINSIVFNILDWLNPLKKNNTDNRLAQKVHHNIKLSIFNEKRSLMRSFRDRIIKLEMIVNEGINDL